MVETLDDHNAHRQEKEHPSQEANKANSSKQIYSFIGGGVVFICIVILVLMNLNPSGMVWVQGGTFNMGSNDVDDTPVHQVTVSSFYISKCEVTQSEWQAVMGYNPSLNNKCDNCPVENISWDSARAYCLKKSGLEGKIYRLPTEAEWEYAARGGKNSNGYTYSGGNDPGEVGWDANNSYGKTHPVHQKSANELGLYDMSGNVWEWCSDWYGSYNRSPAQNPQGPSKGLGRVLRGGSWFNSPEGCRTTMRTHSDTTTSPFSPLVGFRTVVSF